ncbi:MAG: DUF4390 domain-containing protein [Desulfobacula sp.]|nr:DUF4390 domain-containing protein [Desulfobacula sp.]
MRESYFHKTNISLIIALIAALGVLLPAMVLAKDNAVIKNIKLANTRDHLLTYFDIKKAFTPKINQAILNGVPTVFSFYVSLYKTQGSWFDKKVADIEIKSTLKYNSLKKEFSILKPWKNKDPMIVQSLEKAKPLMAQINNLKILPLNQLVKGEKYQLRIKAKLDRVTLPLSMHNVLFFVSFWDFETNWYIVNFTY